LSNWQPGDEALNADAMLFAAGLAAGTSRRNGLWLAGLCGFLALLSAGLGAWGLRERSELVAMAARLRGAGPAPNMPQEVLLPAYSPSPEDYWHLRTLLSQDSSRLLVSTPAAGAITPPLPLSGPPILRAGQRDAGVETAK
jgi:hypothetical protein